MAAGTFQPIRPFSREIFEKGTIALKEDAAQDFKAGCPLIVAAGYAQEVGAAPALIYAIAAEDAHNTVAAGTSDIQVWLVDDQSLWEITLLEAAAVALFAVAEYGIVEDAGTQTWYASTADAGDQLSLVRSAETIGGLTAVTDTKTRVLCRFAAANIQNP